MSKQEGVLEPLVIIVVLHYQGAPLTLACLQSLKQLTYPRFRVLLVDNSSVDNGSVDSGSVDSGSVDSSSVDSSSVDNDSVDNVSADRNLAATIATVADFSEVEYLKMPTNRGFAGGCNAGFQYA